MNMDVIYISLYSNTNMSPNQHEIRALGVSQTKTYKKSYRVVSS